MRSLHIEENANIVLFLAHLSKNPLIIDELITVADGIYKDDEPLSMGADLQQIEDASLRKGTLYLPDSSPDESRKEILDELDAERDRDVCTSPDDDTSTEDDELLKSLNSALKTLQILGQLLKNFGGSLSGEKKIRITRS